MRSLSSKTRALCWSRSISSSASRRSFAPNSSFWISEEVRQAISEQRPVVALESTIYTHGFPYPENLALASHLESLVRLNGGIPATIGILEGQARVGFGADELVRLVSSKSPLKVSRRDLGFALGLRDADGLPFSGGTTVSGTMILAHLAGIKIFATGGLGGVHRGAEQTMDVSADLTELGRTPLAVISSGCKSFLDISKTLEYLETQGVAVATFADGRTGAVDFPAFYTRDSGVSSPAVLQNESDAARVIHSQHALGLQSGLLFANPIPEQFSIPFQDMEATINQVLLDATAAGAIGAASTPYILAKLKDLTGSQSVQANRALVEANVIRGTKVAVQLCTLEAESSRTSTPSLGAKSYGASSRSGTTVRNTSEHTRTEMIGPAAINYTNQGALSGIGLAHDTPADQPALGLAETASELTSVSQVFVAGSLAVDLSCDYAPPPGLSTGSPALQTSNPARIAQTLGGVGHNVARAAHLMGADVRLCTAVGDDLTGKAALEALEGSGMSSTGVKVFSKESGSRTAQYVAINDMNKDLVLAMADMSILEKPTEGVDVVADTFDEFWSPQVQQAKPSYLALDGNWQPAYLARWLQAGKHAGTHITFEPVSNAKAVRLFQLPASAPLSTFPNPSVHLATPNAYELSAMYMAARESGALDRSDWWGVIDALGIPSTGARTQLALATSSGLVDHGIPQQSIQLLPFIPSICTKLGAAGVLLTQLIPAHDERLTSAEYAPFILSRCTNDTEATLGVGGVYIRLFPSVEEVKPEEVVSVNGVGDTFAGTLLAGLAKKGAGARVEDLIDLAQRAAVLTLRSGESVAGGLRTLRILL